MKRRRGTLSVYILPYCGGFSIPGYGVWLLHLMKMLQVHHDHLSADCECSSHRMYQYEPSGWYDEKSTDYYVVMVYQVCLYESAIWYDQESRGGGWDLGPYFSAPPHPTQVAALLITHATSNQERPTINTTRARASTASSPMGQVKKCALLISVASRSLLE